MGRRRFLRELVVRYQRKDRWRLPAEGYKTSLDIYKAFKGLALHPRERMIAVLLDNRSRPIGFETTTMGTTRGTMAEAGCVYQAAIIAGATGVILVHNHPSGISEPSREDRAVTDRLRLVGELVGIQLVDHVIIGHDGFYSFADSGQLKSA